jgi:hypothetical protein
VKKLVISIFGFTIALLGSTPASALMRAYVSSQGTNGAGCGAIASPCRTFQYAHNYIVSPKGEIVVLDSGDYGAITITKSISIVNDGAGTAGVQTGVNANAITIATTSATDVVHLRGIEIDGFGVAANGIVFKGKGALDVVRCVVRRFAGANPDGTGHGIAILQSGASPVSASVTDTIVSDNKGVGIYFSQAAGAASVQGLVNRTTMARNWIGIDLNAFSSGKSIEVTVDGSMIDKNDIGVYLLGNPGAAWGVFLNTTITHSAGAGMHVDASAYAEISEVRYVRNSAGNSPECANGGIIWSSGDNIVASSSCMGTISKH